MQLVSFFMIFLLCTMMILKTESSHTFKELGFHFRNKNVHDYLKDQASELSQICLGIRKYYITH
jgi:hypothetical protein